MENIEKLPERLGESGQIADVEKINMIPGAVNSLIDAVENKQDKLSDGVNIKTINNQSILGEGNITIQGGTVAVGDGTMGTIDYEGADFSIQDEQGNSILKILKGHIVTKNFNSSYASGGGGGGTDLISKFANKKFAIIGDSISTFSGWIPSGYENNYPRDGSDVTEVGHCWWFQLLQKLGIEDPVSETNIKNVAWSGSTVSVYSGYSSGTAKAACNDARINDINANGFVPDIVICYIGCNDWGLNVPIGDWNYESVIGSGSTTFAHAYAEMLHKLHVKFPNARVFCCTLLDDKKDNRDKIGPNMYPSINNAGVAIARFNETIKNVAMALSCDVIDLNCCGINYENLDALTSDGLHPNKAGQELIANKVAQELINKY